MNQPDDKTMIYSTDDGMHVERLEGIIPNDARVGTLWEDSHEYWWRFLGVNHCGSFLVEPLEDEDVDFSAPKMSLELPA